MLDESCRELNSTFTEGVPVIYHIANAELLGRLVEVITPPTWRTSRSPKLYLSALGQNYEELDRHQVRRGQSGPVGRYRVVKSAYSRMLELGEPVGVPRTN